MCWRLRLLNPYFLDLLGRTVRGRSRSGFPMKILTFLPLNSDPSLRPRTFSWTMTLWMTASGLTASFCTGLYNQTNTKILNISQSDATSTHHASSESATWRPGNGWSSQLGAQLRDLYCFIPQSSQSLMYSPDPWSLIITNYMRLE